MHSIAYGTHVPFKPKMAQNSFQPFSADNNFVPLSACTLSTKYDRVLDPCAFCFVAPWSGGLVFNSDARFTNVMADMAEKLRAAIGEKEDQSSGKEIILGPLPGPPLDLKLRTLQSIVIAISAHLQRPPGGLEWSRPLMVARRCAVLQPPSYTTNLQKYV